MSRRATMLALAAGLISLVSLIAMLEQIQGGVRSTWPWSAATFDAPPFYFVVAGADVVALAGAIVASRSPLAGGFVELAAAFIGGVALFVVPVGLVPGYGALVVSQIVWCGLALMIALSLVALGVGGARTAAREEAAWI